MCCWDCTAATTASASCESVTPNGAQLCSSRRNSLTILLADMDGSAATSMFLGLDGCISRVDVHEGQQLTRTWSQPLHQDKGSPCAVAVCAGTVVVSHHNVLVGFDAKSGQEKWHRTLCTRYASSPICASSFGDLVYVLSDGGPLHLSAVSVAQGSDVWKTDLQTSSEMPFGASLLEIANGAGVHMSNAGSCGRFSSPH
jgi:outer membrane protein assembly factor BamB